MGASLLVGCGGSGIRTLIRINQLLAEDMNWRTRIDEEIYYLIIDTENDALDEFQEAINQQLGEELASHVTVRSIRLAQNVANIRPLVNQHFVAPFADGRNVEDKEWLHEHWWTLNGDPYTAEDVSPLSKGAGQCPPVSYFLTWYNLAKIEEVFEDLLRVMLTKRAEDMKRQLEELNFYMVAGLAGGTGRGCWQLIAFKLRELFLNHGVEPTPSAYLLDSTIFYSLLRGEPQKKIAMMVNSLTGISELSCWIRNIEQTAAGSTIYRYNLPAMQNPERDRPALKVDLNVRKAASPINAAYLVFDRSPVAVLQNYQDYYDMVGTAIYATLTLSDIQASDVNIGGDPYRSLAAATYEINASSLAQYCESQVRIETLRAWAEHVDDEKVEIAVDSFLKKMGIHQLRFEGTAQAGGDFLQRAAHALVQNPAVRQDLDALRDYLSEQDEGEALIKSRAIGDRDYREPVKQAIAATLGEVGCDKAEEDVRQIIEDQLYAETENRPSVQNIVCFVERLSARLTEIRSKLRRAAELESPDLAKEIRERHGREKIVFGPKFSPEEIDEILEKGRLRIIAKGYDLLKDALGGELEKLVKSFDGWKKKTSSLASAIKRARESFGSRMAKKFGCTNYDKVYDRLFADYDQPEKSALGRDDRAKFFRRELRPFMAKDELAAKLVDATVYDSEISKQLRDLILGFIFDKKSLKDSNELSRDLVEVARGGVHLPPDFIEACFSFEGVVAQMRRSWQRRLGREIGNSAKFSVLADQFKAFFGVEVQRPEGSGEIELPSHDEFMLAMAASLARNCKPFWRAASRRPYLPVSVFLPKLNSAISNVQDRVNQTTPDDILIQVPEQGTHVNPFLMLAYASDELADIDQVQSLDYWKQNQNREVVERLKVLEENPEGDAAQMRRPIGFTSPIFVKNEDLRKLRWKPWMPSETAPVEKEKIEQDMALDALLYGIMELPESVHKSFAEGVALSFPLIRDTGRERFCFTRTAYRWRGGKVDDDPRCPWQSSELVAQSVFQVLDMLRGKGKDAAAAAKGDQWRKRILEEKESFFAALPALCSVVEETKPHKALVDACYEQLEDFLALQNRSASEDKDKAAWDSLLKRVDELRKALGIH